MNLTAYDFWGDPTWVGGNDEERCKRLRAYEKYRLAGLRYEKEIAKFKRELAAAVKDLRLAANAAPEEGCLACKHLYDICEDCCWEWRGVCKENTEANHDEEV